MRDANETQRFPQAIVLAQQPVQLRVLERPEDDAGHGKHQKRKIREGKRRAAFGNRFKRVVLFDAREYRRRKMTASRNAEFSENTDFKELLSAHPSFNRFILQKHDLLEISLCDFEHWRL